MELLRVKLSPPSVNAIKIRDCNINFEIYSQQPKAEHKENFGYRTSSICTCISVWWTALTEESSWEFPWKRKQKVEGTLMKVNEDTSHQLSCRHIVKDLRDTLFWNNICLSISILSNICICIWRRLACCKTMINYCGCNSSHFPLCVCWKCVLIWTNCPTVKRSASLSRFVFSIFES